MKVLVQRVLNASVQIDGKVHGDINKGFLLYVCFEQHDANEVILKAVQKILSLRIFEDENLKMNKNINEVHGEILSISQFTLSWDGLKGNRPSFDKSMEPKKAQLMYDEFNSLLKDKVQKLAVGQFGADMKVLSVNDGPVTFMLSF